MSIRRIRQSTSMAIQAAELAVAVPQVVAHRVARMAMAGPALSSRDRIEFQRMGNEKTVALWASWNAMALQMMRANQLFMASLMRASWSVWLTGKVPTGLGAPELQRVALGVMAKGLAPVHRTAVANARRLARTKLR